MRALHRSDVATSTCPMSITRFFLGMALLSLPGQIVLAKGLEGVQKQTLADAANLAQTACYKEIYRDVNAYTQCVRNLVEAEKKPSYKRLGIEYFGFVGALAYLRVSQPGVEQAAAEFLKRYRVTQKALGVNDEELCASVPGNCVVRMAQSRQMEATPAKKPPSMRMQCIQQTCRLMPVEP